MKINPTSLCLLVCFSAASLANETQIEQNNTIKNTPNQTETPLTVIEKACLKEVGKYFEPSEYKRCVSKNGQPAVERIEVLGRYVGIEVPEVQGRFYLGQEFIDNAPRTGGDINDLISLLPGVQLSEGAASLDNLAEISAQQISISGGQPWQTGFFLDGVSFNNSVNPGSTLRTEDSRNDVSGGVQTMNVNSDTVESIEVFDNNIPAEYGDFSGGVVKAKTKSAFDQGDTRVKLSYRGNQSSWVNYHYIYGEDITNQKEPEELTDVEPQFEKQNWNLLASHQFNEHHGFLVNVSYLDSVISDVSLNSLKKSTRRNINASAKYSYRRGWVDRLDLSLVHAPYRSESYLKNYLNSDYYLDGGSTSFAANLSHDFDVLTWQSTFNVSQSENSRTAPPHSYSWIKSKGKDWGIDPEFEEQVISLSKEGGYGNLDSVQQRVNFKNTFTLNTIESLGVEHQINGGVDYLFQKLERNRAQDHYQFSGSVVYASAQEGQTLNCSGFINDCQEQSFYIPIEALETQLGEPLDFGNIEHVIAYSNNVATTAQYFNYRTVQPSENIVVDSARLSAFVTDRVDIGDLNVNLGLRYDRDDFFQNDNFAYRISAGYDVFSDSSMLLILGANRYYSAGTVNYKLKEQQKPTYDEYRSVIGGYVQGWQPLTSTESVAYQYQNLNTPYDNEWVAGWKQSLGQFGNMSIKYVRRFKHDQITQSSESIVDDGIRYLQMSNNGSGNSRRISLAWDGRLGEHSFWFNTSYSKSYSELSNYQLDTHLIALDDLVVYNEELMSRQELDIITDNFSKPMIYNFGWSYSPIETLNVTMTGYYSESYKTPVEFGVEGFGLASSCLTCSSSIEYLVPKYKDLKKRSNTKISLSASWAIKLNEKHSVNVRADISNLFNSRTFIVDERIGESGIEHGRQFWLGVSYEFN